MENHLSLFIPRHDMGCAILSQYNGINDAISQGLLAEFCLAGNGVRHSLSSFSQILTRVGRKKFHVKVACWNVQTLLQTGNWRT